MRLKRLTRGLLLLLFSCVPGCGQMYQGYMRRGISQTILCCAAIALAVFLEIGALVVLVVPLWLYSFFDSFDLHRRLSGGGLESLGTAEPDAFLFGISELDAERLSRLLDKRHSLIGWTLVLLGVYALYNTVAREVLGFLREIFPWTGWIYDLLVWDMPRIAGTLLIIALGVWFIRGPRRRTEDAFVPSGPSVPPAEEERPVYRPEFFQEAPRAPEPPIAPEVPGGEGEDAHDGG